MSRTAEWPHRHTLIQGRVASPSGGLLRSLGFSAQKPEKRAT